MFTSKNEPDGNQTDAHPAEDKCILFYKQPNAADTAEVEMSNASCIRKLDIYTSQATVPHQHFLGYLQFFPLSFFAFLQCEENDVVVFLLNHIKTHEAKRKWIACY